ncbi:hypothetical protein VNO80_00400 [Phaseolus coccineus]|uniref:Uncharacterized protein n=1 Tax=Phaseolus coccineus TaxID=3886 RepID=A0AAN9NZW9_PHACN
MKALQRQIFPSALTKAIENVVAAVVAVVAAVAVALLATGHPRSIFGYVLDLEIASHQITVEGEEVGNRVVMMEKCLWIFKHLVLYVLCLFLWLLRLMALSATLCIFSLLRRISH